MRQATPQTCRVGPVSTFRQGLSVRPLLFRERESLDELGRRVADACVANGRRIVVLYGAFPETAPYALPLADGTRQQRVEHERAFRRHFERRGAGTERRQPPIRHRREELARVLSVRADLN